ncbi:MAG: hypothetical protein ABIJ74_01255 [archaeon]
MPVTCEHCKNPIESKNDLIVMPQWGFLPRPLHKQCWGNLASVHGGVGSVSYGTGAFRKKRGLNIPINSVFFTLIALILLVAGFFVLTMDLSGTTISSNGADRAPTETESILIQVILFFVLLIPLIVRLWSFAAIETRLQ